MSTVTALRTPTATAADTACTVVIGLAHDHGLPIHTATFAHLNGDPIASVTVADYLALRRWAGVLDETPHKRTSDGHNYTLTWHELWAQHDGVSVHVTTDHRRTDKAVAS